LTACLTYLDFFATSTQRTAVTTAANCCRNIPEDSFPVVRDVMPILLNVLSSSDQKVVEQGCLCVSRVVESFKYRQDKLETLISPDLLRAILRLLLPGTTNLIGPNIHTQFLRVLAITARASPRLSVELVKMNVVETLYQILTGVSPPDGTDDVASKIDSVVIMQALIHRPREQIFETLNVICELLPGLPPGSNTIVDDELFESIPPSSEHLVRTSTNGQPSAYQKRIDLLSDCKEELKRFAIILLPTLTDAYSSTVNLSVRQKVLNAQLKMLSNLDSAILEDALRTVPYASFLASILSQQDHPTLALSALQAAELLLKRLETIYRYQFYREGVMTEISILAKKASKEQVSPKSKALEEKTTKGDQRQKTPTKKQPDDSDSGLMLGVNEDGDSSDMDGDDDDVRDDGSESSLSSRGSSSSGRNHPVAPASSNMQAFLRMQAQKFLDVHENESDGKAMREKAMAILEDLRNLSSEVRASYLQDGVGSGASVFRELSKYFDGDAIDSITSSELLNSGIVRVLLDVFDGPDS
jgi:E3 ubiquitin-protein ligase TRIP12